MVDLLVLVVLGSAAAMLGQVSRCALDFSVLSRVVKLLQMGPKGLDSIEETFSFACARLPRPTWPWQRDAQREVPELHTDGGRD
jgi:hypothetical protein